MIVRAWGTWDLFQSLLLVLRSIADRHEKTIANIATRWVLDHSFVGAVLIGMYILWRIDVLMGSYMAVV